MDYPQNLLQTLEALYDLGQRTCTEVEQFDPVIVVGLAHSGWMPVIVARALWSETHSTAFPPAVRTNIGQEKNDIYKERFKPSMPAYCCGECCDGNTDRIGHYLAWITVQQPWLDTLHIQVQSVFQGEPARILVVDDLFGGYRTCYIALGLLETLYPQARVRMIAGTKDLTNDFVDAWLLQFLPAVGSEVAQTTEQKSRARYTNRWHEQLKPLITGSEDITSESLDWQPLGPGSPAIQALAGLAEPETILAAPSWAASLACRYAVQRQKGELEGVELVPDDDNFFMWRRTTLTLEPEERLFRQAWLNNGISRKEIASAFENLPLGVEGGLKKVKEFARPHGRGRGAVYLPDEATDSWVTAYNLRGDEKNKLHITGFSEFLPGQLWAGAYPFDDPKIQVGMLKDLLSLGVRRIIDLTMPTDYYARWPYVEALSQANQQLGIAAERILYPLRPRSAPTHQQMLGLFDLIQSLLDSGEGIYLHGGHNLEGRVPMVLACLLVNQGKSPEQALSLVTDFWLQTLPYLIRLPLSEAQRQNVLHWKGI